MANILSVISVCGPNGGTAVKLKKLVEESKHKNFVYFAIYDKGSIKEYSKNKLWFESDNKVAIFEGFYGRNFIRYSFEIIRLIKQNKIEVVNFYFNFENTFAPLIKLFCPKVVLVRSIVGYDEPLPMLRATFLNFVLKPIDHVIFISKYIKDLYTHDYETLKTKPSSIIYNAGIKVTDIITDTGNRENLVSISGLCERKNLEVLVQAMVSVVKEFPNQKLFILGDGELRPKFENQIRDLGLVENVILVGYTNLITEYLNNCSIYVHPANTEGFGIAVTEAMSMKCPCIVSDAGALPELIVDNESGFIVDEKDSKVWAEKILFLLRNPEIRIQMANAAHIRAKEVFPLSSFIGKHDSLYENLVK